MGLVEYIHPSLATADWEQLNVKLNYIGLSFAFFCAVYGASSAVSSPLVTYKNLRTKEKIFWNLAIVRAVYGIYCTVFGLWAIFVDTELEHDVVFATTPTSHFAMCTTVGFFIFECSMILWSDIYYKQFNLLLNLHHWLSLIAYSTLIYVKSTHFFGTRGLILEMSTPFSCLCWTLLKADMAHTLLWKANQFILVHTFHLRSVVEFSMWYWTYNHWDRIWSAMPMPMFALFYTQLTLVAFVMTPYWTYKKTVQMINPVDWNFEDSNKHKAKNGSVKRE
ncbi:protein CLN8-like [Dreissena polymorpha]|uniref:TLC domain-containing protein n=1 Tax=Dreissena polymorpha TaxID=45954 RepID=A0A9D4MQ31_DREPO|nr:protein CLN8-like [Dreissena polymorpha]XP_052260874.1 protein CLN8-like [Dreissena polymorpha]KAH3880135.1 hypothetical protein DPMN_004048 [Dreissena polymorpha]